MKKGFGRGFTIVELLIVVVVIAILAAITIVAYNGIQNSARQSSASAAAHQAATKLALYSVKNGQFPTTLSDVSISDSGDTEFRYFVNNDVNPKRWCTIATIGDTSYFTSSTQGSSVEGVCAGPGEGNISPELAYWTLSSPTGPFSFNSSGSELLMVKAGGSGTVSSPLLYVGESRSVTLRYQMYPTSPSVNNAPQSAAYTSSSYYGEDGVTLVDNSAGYKGNGNARAFDLNVWSDYSVSFSTGPNVRYIRYTINAAPTSYTSDTRIRNVEVTVSR